MFSDSVIDPATIQAYLQTEYRVGGDQPFTLKIELSSAVLLMPSKPHNAIANDEVKIYKYPVF